MSRGRHRRPKPSHVTAARFSAGVTLTAIAGVMAASAPASAAESDDANNGGGFYNLSSLATSRPVLAPQLTNAGSSSAPAALEWAIQGTEAEWDSEERDDDRAGFTQTMVDRLKDASGGQYNAMVFNVEDQGYIADLTGGPAEGDKPFMAKANYDGEEYGVYVFKEGNFRNLGDGGYENWAFTGSFERQPGWGAGEVDFSTQQSTDAAIRTCASNQGDGDPLREFDCEG